MVKELFSKASSSSGKYSVAADVGSDDDSSMEMSKVANSPVVAELPFPPGMLPPLFKPLLPLLMKSSNGSSAAQHVSMEIDATSIIKNNVFFIFLPLFFALLLALLFLFAANLIIYHLSEKTIQRAG